VDTGARALTIAVIFILGLIWAAVLIPPILRARSAQPRSDSVGDFRYRLSMLGQTNGFHRHRPERTSMARPAFAPATRPGHQSPAQKRRKDVLLVMLGVCAGTLFLAVLSRMTALFALHLLADGVLAGYVYLLVQYKHRAQEQRTKVRFLSTAYRSPAPYLVTKEGAGERDTSGPRLVPLRQTASN
jgi:hypothetical protein